MWTPPASSWPIRVAPSRWWPPPVRRCGLLELFQLQEEEGACLDCYRGGAAVTCADLSADPTQWPRFSAAARELGFTAVHAFPLRLRDQVLGAIGLFNATPGALSEDTTTVAQALADVATIGILNERTLRGTKWSPSSSTRAQQQGAARTGQGNARGARRDRAWATPSPSSADTPATTTGRCPRSRGN